MNDLLTNSPNTSALSYTIDNNFIYTNSNNVLTFNNLENMNTQVKVAVFRVKRNKSNQIKSSTFLIETWIEKKPGISIEYAIAVELKELAGGNFKADEIVIKELQTVTL